MLRTFSLLLALMVACQLPATGVKVDLGNPTAIEQPAAQASARSTPKPSETATPSPTEASSQALFAVIGDYGQAGGHAFQVAEMIDSWRVDFIVTTGDNNYPDGAASTIDENIGQYYHRYIGNYKGDYNRGSETNRFFPSLGNHDWALETIEPYLDYFTLPGNERYYDVAIPPVHLFILDDDPHEPDGVGISSKQATWLKETMGASQEAWNIVVMHFPPYSSGLHGSTDWAQWPYKDWGADAVLSGHDHLYERLDVGGLLYITNGLGGFPKIYDFYDILPQSQFRYNDQYGAMRAYATNQTITFEFFNVDGQVIDSVTLNK